MKKSVFSTHLLHHPTDPSMPAPAIEFQIQQKTRTIPVGSLVAGETTTIRAVGRPRVSGPATYRKNPQRQRGVFGKRLHRRGWAPL